MEIALNGRILQTVKPAGPEYFAYNLYKSLFENFKDIGFTIYCSRIESNTILKKLTDEFPKVKIEVVANKISWTHVGLVKALLKDKPDAYFTPEHTIPFIRAKHTKFITMIHGLEFKSNKQQNGFDVKYFIHPLLLKFVGMNSDLIITPSEYTKQQLITNNIAPSNKIQIIREGTSDLFRQKPSLEIIEKAKSKYNLHKKYLVFVSTLQPRKNIENLVKAFVQSNIQDYILVLIGKKGWKYESIFETINNLKAENLVKHLDWVPEEDLLALMSGASGFVNFSFEEGFSLTLLEAMSLQIPAAVSDIPAHKELGKDAVIYADPNNMESIKNAIIKLTTSDNSLYINKAFEYSKDYNWESTAKQLFDAIKSIQS